MKNSEITFAQLIRYFYKTGTKELNQKIEGRRKIDPDFEEEMQMWEHFIQTFDDLESAIEKLQNLHQKWYEVKLFDLGKELNLPATSTN